MFRVTRYPMISKTESGRVGYRKKYRVAGRVRVPAGHCPHPFMHSCIHSFIHSSVSPAHSFLISATRRSLVGRATHTWCCPSASLRSPLSRSTSRTVSTQSRRQLILIIVICNQLITFDCLQFVELDWNSSDANTSQWIRWSYHAEFPMEQATGASLTVEVTFAFIIFLYL